MLINAAMVEIQTAKKVWTDGFSVEISDIRISVNFLISAPLISTSYDISTDF